MRNPYSNRNNSKIIFYALAIAVVIGIGVVVVQDINVPTEHVSQKVAVNVAKK
ncbi:MAG: hypothetical protein J6Y91_02980 [Alphaproteobacteria bacterium]|nr:hypothetical protein [Alphaproteobacteria bacterium]